MSKKFYGHGKLMLTGEYVVLDGAASLAMPCKMGQWLEVTPVGKKNLYWISIDEQGHSWFTAELSANLNILKTSDRGIAQKLVLLLSEAQNMNPDFARQLNGVKVNTTLEFNRNWGLGSSSTVVYAVAQWAKVDPLLLSESTFGGSGYDVACAGASGPIVYRIVNDESKVEPVVYDPPFKDNLHFIWLGQKQLSNREIGRYSTLQFDRKAVVADISEITKKVLKATTLEEFSELMNKHEQILSRVLQTETAKQLLFPEIDGLITSLGAWGGDFVLHAGDIGEIDLIRAKGFNTIIPWRKMVLR